MVTPSYENPHAKWVMTDVMVEDGYDTTNDGFDTYKKKYQYDKPRYDRREREFYGFETVKALDYTMDTSGNPVTVYRRTETKYHNKSYFLNGLVIDNTVYKGAAATPVFSKTINTYAIRTLDASGYINLTGAAQAVTYDTGGREGRRSGAVLLTKTQQYLYELGTTPLTTETNFTYNKYGAVLEHVNLGAAGTADDYKTTIKYHENPELLTMNMVAIPQSITVNAVTGNTLLRQRTTKVELTKGQVTQMATKLNTTEDAITDFEYDSYGNIKKVTLPANETGQRMDYNYTYDSVDNKYIVHTRDAFNYVSTSTYEPKFDKVLSTTDMTGTTMTYTYDKFGRLLTVLAPNELASSKPYTIKFEYYPIVANLPAGTCITTPEKFMPFAVTKHFDVQHPTNDIETITIMDGLARVVQVKKDIQMNVGTSASPTIEERMSVSGMIMYDEFGRVIRQYHPWHEAKQCSVNQLFNSTPTANYSVTTFDQLDRPLKIKDPDGGDTDFVYNLATDGLGAVAHMTRTTVSNTPNPTITEVYKDITGKVTSTKNVLTGTTSTNIWTKFAYNAVGDIMTYTDDANMITSYEYDLAGRKTSMTHPDTGKTSYVYNPSGNVIKLQTANMAADSSIPLPANRYIKYEYDYNRIKTIKYPSPGGTNIANVTYTYGSAGGGTTNNTGRLINQKDATGEQSFVYGKMGEIIKNTRKVICPNVPSRTFITEFGYDSWNRLLTLTYPDNEQVSYSYDLGGNLSSVETSIEPLVYVKRIDYDYFEQRTFIKYGNNTETAYTYTNKLRRLDKLVSKTATNQTFLNGQYTYDKIGNITKFENTAGPLITGKMGGTYTNTYMYDNLSRLTSSIGNYTGDASQAGNNNDYVAAYSTAMEYNTTHGIVKKTQTHTKNTLTVAANSYQDNYTYLADTHRLQNVADANSTMEESFKYDLNGNITVRDKTATDARKLFWDENNRLRAVVDKKLMQHNIYDAAGERVLKGRANVEELYNNGMPVDGSITFQGYTMYPSGYIVLADKGKYTKHYYIGSQRMLSRIGDKDITAFKAVSTMAIEQSETTEAEGESLDEDALRASQVADITDILLKAERGTPVFKEYEPEEEEEEADQANDNAGERAGLMMAPPVLGLYYYHPDHLGSSTYLTDASGLLYQFYLNLPFGETMAEQHSLTEDYETPYKFNGKELDTDTGYYYYGARYYEPRISIWLSTDPLMEKYPDVNPYGYCIQNPINLTDPTGMSVEGNEIDPPVKNPRKAATRPEGMSEAEALSHTVEIEGKKYHKYTSNTVNQALNEINSWFGGSNDYFVEHKEYDPVSDRMLVESIKANAIVAGGGLVINALTPSGKIYEVDGSKTESGKPYIGRTKQESPAKRGVGAKDGRDRTNAKIIDKYNPNKAGHGSYKEQKAIDKRGGIKNLDNKRNEATPKRMEDLKRRYGKY